MNLRWGGVLLVVGLSACMARLYPGPKRPDAEIAIIETDGMTVVAVDDQRADPGLGTSRYEILPGMHAVSVRLSDDHPVNGDYTAGRRVSDFATAVCFKARENHKYLVRPVYSGASWRPEIIDENVPAVIASKVTTAAAPDCSPEAPRVVAPVVAQDEAAPAPPVPDGGSAAASPDGAVAASPADAGVVAIADAPPAPPPPRTVRPATDAEVPRARWRRTDAAPPPPPAHPGTGVGLEMGFAIGGDELANATLSNGDMQQLKAGDGLVIALVGDVTPFWGGDGVGLGFGASLGLKYDSIGASNGSVSLSRFPLSIFVQLLPRLDDRWFFQLRGGLTKALGTTMSGSGVAAFDDVSFDSQLGGFGELGLYRAFLRGSGMLFAARYTHEKLRLQEQSIDASSIGLSFGIYYSNQ